VDLNYLYKRHQISLFMSDCASSEEARRAHRELAEGYASRIVAAKNPSAASGAISCNG
jgi:hypothetical protein